MADVRTWVIGSAVWSVPRGKWEELWRQADNTAKWVNDPARAEAEGVFKLMTFGA